MVVVDEGSDGGNLLVGVAGFDAFVDRHSNREGFGMMTMGSGSWVAGRVDRDLAEVLWQSWKPLVEAWLETLVMRDEGVV